MPPAPASGTLVLLHDSRWPSMPGVCCWRNGITEAASEAELAVREVAWVPAAAGLVDRGQAAAEAVAAVVAAGWVATLVGRSRGRLRRALRVARRARRRAARVARIVARRGRGGRGTAVPADLGRARRTGTDPYLVQTLGPQLASARIVVAESVEAATDAVRVSSADVWALVLPPERIMPGQPAPWATRLRQSLDAVPLTGLVTDSEVARDIVDRAVSPLRVPVVVLPPLAADRRCPSCPVSVENPADPAAAQGGDAGAAPETHRAASVAQAPTQPGAEVTRMVEITVEVESGTGSEAVADDVPTDAPGQLGLWHALLAEAANGPLAPRPWSFPLVRLVGADQVFPDARGDAWGGPRPSGYEVDSTWSAVAQRQAVQELIRSARPAAPSPTLGRKVAIVGFDLKFIRELVGRLERSTDLAIEMDEWSGPSTPTPGVTGPLVAAAQTLVGEWVRPNAAWLSAVKRPDQQLVLRLHRFEVDSDYPASVAIDNVDAVVYIAPWIGRRIVDRLAWPADKLLYIPNFVDVDWVDRPKYADARFTLGLGGAIPSRKRLDLALDLLAEVRAQDARFVLSVRTQQPWDNKYTWRSPDERRYYQRCLERIETDPLLRGAVTFDPFGRDVAAWLRRVGHVLSPSDAEGAPVALSEGMASGAVPVLRPWPGAADLFGPWVQPSVRSAAAFVLESVEAAVWADRAGQARAEARRTFDPGKVIAAWADLLHGDREQARTYFADWVRPPALDPAPAYPAPSGPAPSDTW